MWILHITRWDAPSGFSGDTAVTSVRMEVQLFDTEEAACDALHACATAEWKVQCGCTSCIDKYLQNKRPVRGQTFYAWPEASMEVQRLCANGDRDEDGPNRAEFCTGF